MGVQPPLVSILMTSYNTGLYIEEAIRSILAQTYTRWELLLADDCSTDNTREVIARFTDPRIKVFHNSQNLHYLRTRNQLVTHVQGEFIALLDSDDSCPPDKIEKQVDAFLRDPELALCGTLIQYMSREGQPLNVADQKPLTYPEIQKSYKTSNCFTGSSIMVRTEIWKGAGGYRDFFNTLGYEDYDLTSRIVEKHKAINLGERLYNYRQYPESTSRRDMLYNPFKMHGHLLIQHFAEERQQSGQDSLDRNDIPAIINFILRANRPYVDDPSLIYRGMMWEYLHRKMHWQALKFILIAIRLRPFKFTNYRALLLLVLITLRIIKE